MVLGHQRVTSFASSLPLYSLLSAGLLLLNNYYHIYKYFASPPYEQETLLIVWDSSQYLTISAVAVLAIIVKGRSGRIYIAGVAVSFLFDALNTFIDGNYEGLTVDTVEYLILSIVAAAVYEKPERTPIGFKMP